MLEALRSTLKNTFVYSIGTFSSRLVSFILIPVYTSHFSVEEYGIMGILEISAQVLIAMLGFSLYNAYFRWYYDKQYGGRQKSILFTILVFLFFQITLFVILGFSFQRYLSMLLLNSDQYVYLIRLLLVVCSFESIGILVATLLRLKEKALYYASLQVIKLLVNLLLTIYLIVYRGKNIEAVYEAQVIGNIVYFVLILNLLRKSITLQFEGKLLREMLSFSAPLVLTSVSGIVLNITDRYTLRFISGMSDVGIYSLGFKLANTIRVFVIGSVSLALQPMIFKMMNEPNNKRFYAKTMTYFTYGLMFFVLFFALYAPEIIKVISKENMDYWSAYKIVPVLSFSMLFSMLRDVSFTGLNLMKKTKIIAVLIIISAILNILLNVLFIPRWDFYGAAAATTSSQFFYFVMVFRYAQKHYRIPYETKKITLMTLIGVLLTLAGLLLNPLHVLPRVILKLLLILSFPVILYFLKFYEAIELERISQFWKKWRNPRAWPKNLHKIKLN